MVQVAVPAPAGHAALRRSALVAAMGGGMSGISKGQVSRLRQEIHERVKVFLKRPLEGDWPVNARAKLLDD